MSLFHIILKSLRQHWMSTGMAVFSIGMGVALLVAVISLYEQAHANFKQERQGIDAVLGPKGSPLQIVLNAVYNLEEMPKPGKIPWPFYQKVSKAQGVVDSFPFCTGHSYAGFRVNAIDGRFLTDFEYEKGKPGVPGKHFSFRPEDGGQGRPFGVGEEAVAGWEAAQALHLHLGDTFNPVCGVTEGDPVHRNNIRFVGVLGRTGTPFDRAIYIPLTTFYQLEGHEGAARMAVDEQFREISGAYLKIKEGENGALSPLILGLKDIDNSKEAQLVVLNEVLPTLFNIIGWADITLLAIALLVTLQSALFLLVSLLAALRERRRDLALMRSLGATRRTVFGLVLTESVVMAALGGVVGLLVGHVIVWIGAGFIRVETGLMFSELYVSWADVFLFPAIVALGLIVGAIPAIQAYRSGVLKNLTPVS
jgi:putative ABC transport system permease protein